jgi:dGTPase
MLAADEGYLQHNRLTHSLKVAQVGRRISENLCRYADTPRLRRVIDRRGGLDPDVVEAAGLAHDLGHPPFGHIAEEELKRLVEAQGVRDSFEGNAQSFRIVVRLAAIDTEFPGLDLTRATLNAILKYPWPRAGPIKKWGAFQSEVSDFEWARDGYFSRGERSLEADIMDWADDITYAIHDVEDFYRVGLIPLGRLRDKRDPDVSKILERTQEKLRTESDPRYQMDIPVSVIARAWDETLATFTMSSYDESATNRAKINKYSSGLIGTYVDGTGITAAGTLKLPRPFRVQIALLKELTKFYVVEAPALATQQQGQRRLIENLFGQYFAALERGTASKSSSAARLTSTMFPTSMAEMVVTAIEDKSDNATRCRLATDTVAGMTEAQALRIHHRLMGFEFGSLVDPAVS